jgi:hypothetical protein
MTIHSAKGLEAPCVLLVDAADPMSREEATLVLETGTPGGGPVVQGVRKQHRDATGRRSGRPPNFGTYSKSKSRRKRLWAASRSPFHGMTRMRGVRMPSPGCRRR